MAEWENVPLDPKKKKKQRVNLEPPRPMAARLKNTINNGIRDIPYLHKSHHTPLVPPKISHKHCLQFLLGYENVLREI